jgi:4-hydroxy-3-polyprenylbenzoate decarboxylase
MNGSDTKTLVVGICGASGGIYGIRLLKALLERDHDVYLILSSSAKQVLAHEMGYGGGDFPEFLKELGVRASARARLTLLDNGNFFSPPASGSFRHHGMVIAPCSMGTLGAIASGLAETLMHRAADVTLKERRPLILVPRETPFNIIHMENMLTVAKAGATVLPASPSFYFGASSVETLVDTVTARILDHLGIAHDLVGQWGV